MQAFKQQDKSKLQHRWRLVGLERGSREGKPTFIRQTRAEWMNVKTSGAEKAKKMDQSQATWRFPRRRVTFSVSLGKVKGSRSARMVWLPGRLDGQSSSFFSWSLLHTWLT